MLDLSRAVARPASSMSRLRTQRSCPPAGSRSMAISPSRTNAIGRAIRTSADGDAGQGRRNRLLLAVRGLAGRRLAGRKRRWRRSAFLDVLVGFRFLLFLVAAHLTLGHGDLPCAR